MAEPDEWSLGFARQAAADFNTFESLQTQQVPECHKLQFLQMACEKLVKAHLYGTGTPSEGVQSSHACVAATLPVVLKQQALFINYSGAAARNALKSGRTIAREIELLSPSVKRDGRRPDNCEYPWEDTNGKVHSPLEWTFSPSQLLVTPSGRAVLKLIRGAIAQRAKSSSS